MRGMIRKIFGRWRSGAPPEKPPTPRKSDEPAWFALYDRLGIPRSLQYPDTSIGRILDQTADRFPALPAVLYGDMKWTYAELLAKVNRAAGGIAQLGVHKGDRVLLTLPNCPEFMVTFFALQKLGAVAVNAGPLFGADDLSELVKMTTPRLIVGLDLQAGALASRGGPESQVPRLCVSLRGYQSLLTRLGYRYKLWSAKRHDAGAACELNFDEMLASAPARPPTVAPMAGALAVLQPTGGTTGTLKVAQLTHRNLLANATQLAVWGRLREGQERVLGVLPMFHAYGLTLTVMMPVLTGAAVSPLTRFKLGQLLDVVEKHRPTIVPLVPAILHAVCDELDRRPRPGVASVLRGSLVLSGAAPLPPTTAKRFEERVGASILQGYGLTEASPVTHSNPPNGARAESIGIPLPDTQVRVVDLIDPSRDAPHGESGELLIHGPQVFSGYFGNSEQTARSLIKDAKGKVWLRTGDVVRTDGDGYFYIIDRCKDMINRAGEKVWPARVERVLLLHKRIADAAVIGRPHPKLNESVVAILATQGEVKDEAKLIAELRELCRERLGPHELPDVYEFADQIPRSALGKLLKYQLRTPGPPVPEEPDREADGN